MARPLRSEYSGAIHHVMFRGNLRRSVFEDERDFRRLLQGLEQTVGRFGLDLLSFVLVPNPVHLLLHGFRGHRARLRRDWSLLDLGRASHELVRSVATIAFSERSHSFAGKIPSSYSRLTHLLLTVRSVASVLTSRPRRPRRRPRREQRSRRDRRRHRPPGQPTGGLPSMASKLPHGPMPVTSRQTCSRPRPAQVRRRVPTLLMPLRPTFPPGSRSTKCSGPATSSSKASST